MNHKLIVFAAVIIGCYIVSITSSGCAQVGMPTGGIKDTLAPVLVNANPDEGATNVSGNKITLSFDEYIQVDDVQANVLMTPVQNNNPVINFNLKSVTIRIKDTLKPNTTYSINFGNSIKDVNENNIFKEFTYVFSTGSYIDSLRFSGKVTMAETGKIDTTITALLYRNADDTSVRTRKPDYMARVNAEGNFTFRNLPPGNFKVYALKDGDGGKTYNSKTEIFAFRQNNEDVVVGDSTKPVTLYAYEEEKPTPPGATEAPKPKIEKKLRYTAQPGKQDLLAPLVITFNNPVTYDSQKIYLTDTNYNRLSNATLSLDSTRRLLSVATPWQPETNYILMIEKDAAKDSLNNSIAVADTVKFVTKRTEDYGKVLLRFSGLDLAKKPVLQLLEGETVKFTYPITGTEWRDDLFPPGEYGIRVLYDTNGNTVWDPGNFAKNLQPELTVTMSQKLSVKGNWENEREIKLN